MTIAIGTYIHYLTYEGEEIGQAFQNFHVNETREFAGRDYVFAGFGYSGMTVDLEGGNVTSNITFSVNELSLNHAKQAADERWVVEVSTVFLDPLSLDEQQSYQTDRYGVVGFEHDSLRLSLRLSSPLDAVVADVPRRRLTESLVGNLPSTGNIALR